MAAGEFAGVDPEAWKIVDGKLYLGYSKASSERWSQNARANIQRADREWAKLKEN